MLSLKCKRDKKIKSKDETALISSHFFNIYIPLIRGNAEIKIAGAQDLPSITAFSSFR